MDEYYTILGVDKNSTQDEIKKAYRRLAAQHHPDRGGDTKKFQEIQVAYDTLGDPEKRRAYDNPPQQNFQQFGGMPPGFEEFFSQAFGNSPFGDIFGGRRTQPRNRTLNLNTQISLEDAFNGKDLIATIRLPSGRDQVLEVRVPEGIRDGMTLRLAGMGDDTVANAPRGDIHLSVQVLPHNKFRRNNDDLLMDLEINCFEAILGKKEFIETLDKKTLELNIPPGIQPDQTLAVQGYGMPKLEDSRMKGRLLINVKIKIPTFLDDSQKEIIRKFIQ